MNWKCGHCGCEISCAAGGDPVAQSLRLSSWNRQIEKHQESCKP